MNKYIFSFHNSSHMHLTFFERINTANNFCVGILLQCIVFINISYSVAAVSSFESFPEDTTSIRYDADNENIQFVGRVDYTDPKRPVFSAPAVYIQTEFRGVSCKVLLQDEFLYGRKNFYEVIVDNNIVKKIVPTPGVIVYNIISGLANTKHTIKFIKRTEASVGRCTFLGFEFGGTILPSKSLHERKIIFFGNSISVGAGNEGNRNGEECQEWNRSMEYSNANISFASLLAQHLQADYHLIGFSGIGLVRNFTSGNDLTMPVVFDHLHLADKNSSKWDMKKFIPDAVVMELGTNDFSPGDNPPATPRVKMDVATFVASYIQFIDTISKLYPKAHLFCMYSPLLADGWPDSTYHSATDHIKSLAMINQHIVKNKISHVHILKVSKVEGLGCTYHPSAAEHLQIEKEIELKVKSALKWDK